MGHCVEYEFFNGDITRSDIKREIINIVGRSGDGYGTSSIEFHSQILNSEKEAYEFIKENDMDGFYKGIAVRCYDVSANKPTKKFQEIKSKIEEIKEKRNLFIQENHVRNRSVAYITCPKCGSKLNKTYLHSDRCPCCGKDLRSEKILEKINTFDTKINEFEVKLENEKVKSISKDTPVVWVVKYEYHS